MAKKKKSKIIRYRHPLNINVGMIIFAIIFVYLVFSVYTYMKKEKVQFYEIVEGNIVNDRQYTGIILRDERVESTDRAGYINYYIREGKRAAIGTRIYSIDETGNMAELMQENPAISIELPLKISVWEDKNGKVWTSFPQMKRLASEYGLEKEPVIEKMQELLENIVYQAAGIKEDK